MVTQDIRLPPWRWDGTPGHRRARARVHAGTIDLDMHIRHGKKVRRQGGRTKNPPLRDDDRRLRRKPQRLVEGARDEKGGPLQADRAADRRCAKTGIVEQRLARKIARAQLFGPFSRLSRNRTTNRRSGGRPLSRYGSSRAQAHREVPSMPLERRCPHRSQIVQVEHHDHRRRPRIALDG
ncbi:MAG: hypothetical protein ACLTMP_09820 [Eggerthella lenta]